MCVCDMHLCLSCSWWWVQASVCWRIHAWRAQMWCMCSIYKHVSCRSFVKCFSFEDSPLFLFSLPFLSHLRGLLPSSRSLTVLKDTGAQPAGLGFLLCSHSTWVPLGPRWNEIHMFKRFSCKYVHFTAGCWVALQIEQRKRISVMVYQDVILWDLPILKDHC